MRNLIAVLVGGFVAMVLFQVGAVITFVALYGIPLGASPEPPGLGFFTLNLGFAGAAALTGGWVTARLASEHPLAHVIVLMLGIVVLVLWGFTKPASQWPNWYPTTLALISAVATIAGGLLRSVRKQK